ncbi:WYL domain-containing protein [Cysteiniphilum sp. QT6929]|uniref:helix-turn-helix transcriptional regulator n=1 Tax=Cysteiniphilum sp. QT6929 TaxID=2975055 RepID=UPI0024B31FE2|nr:WYL domain-containing protein [Cysteiniphilum sp. QT6929]WHN64970.1 WYL domain-containing protein [Cysteiniphilum sp. QT6929]
MFDSALAQVNTKLGRLLFLFNNIPLSPQSISTTDLHKKMCEYGAEITKKTCERDLEFLQDLSALLMTKKGRANHYSWDRNASFLNFSRFSQDVSLYLLFADSHLRYLTPVNVNQKIVPVIEHAHKTLKKSQYQTSRSWIDKFAMTSRSAVLKAAAINEQVFGKLTEAIYHERRIKLDYVKRGKSVVDTYEGMPLGLSLKDHAMYLWLQKEDDNAGSRRSLHVQRIQQIEVLDEPFIYPKDFNLHHAVEQGIEYLSEKPEKVVLRAYRNERYDTGLHFEENKLADDQQITHHPEYTEISATLKVSGEFVWWVLGFGAHLEVVEPKVLRESITQHLKQMQMRYF